MNKLTDQAINELVDKHLAKGKREDVKGVVCFYKHNYIKDDLFCYQLMKDMKFDVLAPSVMSEDWMVRKLSPTWSFHKVITDTSFNRAILLAALEEKGVKI